MKSFFMVVLSYTILGKLRFPFPDLSRKFEENGILGQGLGMLGNFMLMVNRYSAEGEFGKQMNLNQVHVQV